MSPMPKAQEYRNRAEECIRQAEGCSTETDKNHWLTMAEEWLRMAQQEVQLTGLAKLRSTGTALMKRAPSHNPAALPFAA